MEQCIALRLEIVGLLNQGLLVDLLTDKGKQVFGNRPKACGPKMKEELKRDEPPLKKQFPPAPKAHLDMTINIIVGGSLISGISRAVGCKHCRHLKKKAVIASECVPIDPVTFEDADLEGMRQPHHDARHISKYR